MHRALIALWLLAACAPQPSPASPTQPTPSPTVHEEPQLFGVMQAHEGLTLQVYSGGCRDKSEVRFNVTADALMINELEVDTCAAAVPLGATLQFAWSELPTFHRFGFIPWTMPVLQPGTTPGATTAPDGAVDEQIYGVLVTADGLDIRVFTGGCTGPGDFTTWIEPGEIELVHLVRTKLDRCEAFIPEGQVVHLTWAQLGVTKGRARLVNSIEKLAL